MGNHDQILLLGSDDGPHAQKAKAVWLTERTGEGKVREEMRARTGDPQVEVSAALVARRLADAVFGDHLTPSLAELWTVSADQRVYEFKLREGLRFHNGDPFTAEDVKFSFQRANGATMASSDSRLDWDLTSS